MWPSQIAVQKISVDFVGNKLNPTGTGPFEKFVYLFFGIYDSSWIVG